MRPMFFVDNRSNGATTNSIYLSNVYLSHAVSIQLANAWNILLNQFRLSMPLTLGLIFASFVKHVINIILNGSEKEMIGITARSYVALVETTESVWYGSILQFPCNAMGKFACSVFAYSSVPMPIFVCTPKPTLVRFAFVDLGPESFFEWAATLVSTDKSKWLILDVLILCAILGRKIGLLSTSTVAVSMWDFVSGIVRGMITHDVGSYLANVLPTDVTALRWLSSDNCSTGLAA